jgi:hypothetical protein
VRASPAPGSSLPSICLNFIVLLLLFLTVLALPALEARDEPATLRRAATKRQNSVERAGYTRRALVAATAPTDANQVFFPYLTRGREVISTDWPRFPSPTTAALISIDMLSATDGWAVGAEGTIIRWDGSAWTTVPSPTRSTLTAVAMVAATDGWAGGGRIGCQGRCWSVNEVLRWDGQAWTIAVTYEDSEFGSGTGRVWQLTSMAMTSSTDGWTAGTGVFLHWDGHAWTRLSVPITAVDVDMLSAADGWVVGPDGTTARWDGSVWTVVPSPTLMSLHSIAMLSPTDGWAVGSVGTILHWDGGTWSRVPSLTNAGLGEIAMVSATDGWIVGAGGIILRYSPEQAP